MWISTVAGDAEDTRSTAKQRRTVALLDRSRDRPTGGAAVWRRHSETQSGNQEEEEAHRLMARGSGSGRWSRQRMGFLNTMLRCNLPPETQKVVVFIIMMLLIVINVVLMFLLAFQ